MTARTLLFTCLAMLAFAGNSVLCRLALKATDIDAATFTSLRLLSGALMLWLLVRLRQAKRPAAGSWPAALALFSYAAAFSFAYIKLDAGTGALLLFGAVQLSMLSWGLYRGERLAALAWLGLAAAFTGILGLLLPGATAPALDSALLMILAGASFAVYSLLGKQVADPLASTAGNFLRCVPLAALLSLLCLSDAHVDPAGALYALLSGAVTSGIGYAIWYTALPGLKALQASTVQLSVPVITALAGTLLLGEALSLRLLLGGAAVLGGIALVLGARNRQ